MAKRSANPNIAPRASKPYSKHNLGGGGAGFHFDRMENDNKRKDQFFFNTDSPSGNHNNNDNGNHGKGRGDAKVTKRMSGKVSVEDNQLGCSNDEEEDEEEDSDEDDEDDGSGSDTTAAGEITLVTPSRPASRAQGVKRRRFSSRGSDSSSELSDISSIDNDTMARLEREYHSQNRKRRETLPPDDDDDDDDVAIEFGFYSVSDDDDDQENNAEAGLLEDVLRSGEEGGDDSDFDEDEFLSAVGSDEDADIRSIVDSNFNDHSLEHAEERAIHEEFQDHEADTGYDVASTSEYTEDNNNNIRHQYEENDGFSDSDESEPNFAYDDPFVENNDPALRHLVSTAPGYYGGSDDDMQLWSYFFSSGENSEDSFSSGDPSDADLAERLNEVLDYSGDSTDEDTTIPPPSNQKLKKRPTEILSNNSTSSRPPLLGSWVTSKDHNLGIIDGVNTQSLSPAGSRNIIRCKGSGSSPFSSNGVNSSSRRPSNIVVSGELESDCSELALDEFIYTSDLDQGDSDARSTPGVMDGTSPFGYSRRNVPLSAFRNRISSAQLFGNGNVDSSGYTGLDEAVITPVRSSQTRMRRRNRKLRRRDKKMRKQQASLAAKQALSSTTKYFLSDEDSNASDSYQHHNTNNNNNSSSQYDSPAVITLSPLFRGVS